MGKTFNLAKQKTAANRGGIYNENFDDIDDQIDSGGTNPPPMDSLVMPDEAVAPQRAPALPAVQPDKQGQMVRAIQDWVAAAATDPQNAPAPDPLWFRAVAVKGLKQIPLSLFYTTAEKVLANPAFNMPSASERQQWLLQIVNVFRPQPGAAPDETPEEGAEPASTGHRRVDQGDNSAVALQRDAQTPHVRKLIDLMGNDILKQFSKNRRVTGLQLGDEAISNALFTAFGTADNGVTRNDTRFFVESKGWKFLPDDLKSKLSNGQPTATPPRGGGFETEAAQTLASDPLTYTKLTGILNNLMTVAGSKNPQEVEAAKAQIPVLATMPTVEAQATAKEAVMDRVMRQIHANLNSSEQDQHKQFNRQKSFTALEQGKGGEGTNRKNDSATAGQRQVSDLRGDEDHTLQLARQFQGELPNVANNVRKLGRDISTYMMTAIARPDANVVKNKEYDFGRTMPDPLTGEPVPSKVNRKDPALPPVPNPHSKYHPVDEKGDGGVPRYPLFDQARKYGVALRRYTELLAEELDRLGDPNEIEKLAGMVKALLSSQKTKQPPSQAVNPNAPTTPSPSPSSPAQRFGDDPSHAEAMKSDLYSRATEYKPSTHAGNKDLSSVTGFLQPKMADLVSNKAFAKALSYSIRQNGQEIFRNLPATRSEATRDTGTGNRQDRGGSIQMDNA